MASRTSGQVRSSIQTERVSPYAGSTAKAMAAIRNHTLFIDVSLDVNRSSVPINFMKRLEIFSAI
jgi:hypothetical protein